MSKSAMPLKELVEVWTAKSGRGSRCKGRLTCVARSSSPKVESKPTSRLLSRTSAETNEVGGQSRASTDRTQQDVVGVEGRDEAEDIKIRKYDWYLQSTDVEGERMRL